MSLNLTSDFISYSNTSESVAAAGRKAAQSLVAYGSPPSYEAESPASPVSEGNAIMFQGKLFRMVEEPPSPEASVATDSSASPATSPSQFGDEQHSSQDSVFTQDLQLGCTAFPLVPEWSVDERAAALSGFGVGHC